MKKLLKITSTVYLLIILAGVIYAATELQYFTGKNESDSILLEWKTGTEDNLNRFEIERSASEPNNYVKIGSISAIGNNSYYYFRDNATLMVPESPVYYYRLKLVDNSGNHVYSQTITVTHVISSVRDTWGSIKAIFR
ncbi:MAG: hypothetical protein IT280_06065 [Ignavibacteria bacterium]|nr:hypothetical protein [Ignavibacteria bacterium]